MLSAPTSSPPVTSTSDRVCPGCSASWEDEVTRAAAWLGADALLEGYCSCGSYLVWEHLRSGGWALSSWVPPAASV